MPICPIVASRDKPAVVLSVDKGLINLNHAKVHSTDKIIHITNWVVVPIMGNIQYKIPTMTAPIPNHKAANAGKTSSESINRTPSTNQCQGSRTNSIHLLAYFLRLVNSNCLEKRIDLKRCALITLTDQ